LLPEGKLPSERLRPPKMQGKKEHAVLEADLDRLLEAVRNVAGERRLSDKWESATEVFERFDVSDIKARIAVNRLLSDLHSAGLLSALKAKKSYLAGNGQIRELLVFSTEELNSLLGGRPIAEVAAEWANGRLASRKEAAATDGATVQPPDKATGERGPDKQPITTRQEQETGVAPMKPTKGKRINERMLTVIQDDPEAMYWSAKHWAEHLCCNKSTVLETKTWRNVCKPARERERLARGHRLRGAGRDRSPSEPEFPPDER
jgi:hypothetical protein